MQPVELNDARTREVPSPALVLHLLGPPQILLHGTPLRFAYTQVLALLIYLAVEGDRDHRRLVLAGLLWPDQPEHAARHSLSQALFSLRRTLRDDPAHPLIIATRDTVRFNGDSWAWCDVGAFRAAVRTYPEHAVTHYTGTFLEGWSIGGSAEFEAWALETSEHLRQQVCAVLQQLTEPERWADADHACGYARRWTDLDPLCEEAHRRAMVLLARTGQRAAALLQFERCRALLHAELGIAPEGETIALYEELRRTPPAAPHATALQPTSHIPPTRLIAREHDLAALSDLLADPSRRLITVTGPGGVGKTRVAFQAANDNAPRFADGVQMVSLAPLRDGALVLPAIAQGLGVQQHDDRPLQQHVHAALAPRHLLLLLDNCEHVLPAVVPLVAALLQAAPRVTVVATSRTALRLAHEHCYPLAPLELPSDVDARGAADWQSPAVALFMERATAVRATVARDYAAIAAICRRLDGLPLAIELAAVHTRLLDPADLLARLAPRLPLLHGGPRDVPPRQQTVHATIDWSYRLLQPREQALFRRLAVFAGGWTVAAAEAVCADAQDATIDGMRVLDGLTTLVDASLITPVNGQAAEPRCTMFETIREYALEQLKAWQEHEPTRARHAAWAAALADDAKTAIIGAQGARWSARLLAEHDNVRTALRWAIDAGDAHTALRIGRGVWRFWWRSGFAREGLQMLAAAFAGAGEGDPTIHAEALRAAGVLAWSVDDHEQAYHWLEQGLHIAHTLPDRAPEAAIYTMLGILSRSAGNWAQARAYFEQSRVVSAVLRDRYATRFAIMGLAELAMRLGQLDDAAAGYAECVTLNSAAGDAEGVAAAKRRLANVYCLQERHHADAKRLCEESLALCREVDDKHGRSQTLLVLGDVARAEGDHYTASTYYHESLTMRQQLEKPETCAQVLEAWALSLGACGQDDRAIQLMSAARHIRAEIGAPLTAFEHTRFEGLIVAWRARQGEAAWKRWWQHGQTLTLEQAAQVALQSFCNDTNS